LERMEDILFRIINENLATIAYQGSSELKSVVLTPFLHHLYKVLHLGVVCVLEHLDHLDQALLLLLASHHHLKHADRGAALALPKLGVRV
jgi:hypothetical protein